MPIKIFDTTITLDWIKENITVLILMPTVLGGIWQVLELFQMGLAYVRFFSISQLVADGILVLLLLLLVVAVSYSWISGMGLWIKSISKRLKTNKTTTQGAVSTSEPANTAAPNAKQQPVWKRVVGGYIVMIVIVGAGLFISHFILPELLVPLRTNQPLPLIVILGFCFFGAIFLGLFLMVLNIFLDIHNLFINIDNKIVSFFFTLLLSGGAVGVMIAILFVTQVFHRSFAFPDGLINKEYLRCKIRSTNPKVNRYRIVYFNDQYIFVKQFEGDKKNYIEMYDIAEFTKQENCQPAK